MTQRLYIDIHVIQTVPPSNLNRDDAGTPKQAVYGGARRARVSSQAWKRAARMSFAERMPEGERATRTKKLSTLLARRTQERTGLSEEQAVRLSTNLLKPLGIKPGRRESDTAYLMFLGRRQLDAIADLVVDRAEELAALDDKALEKALDTKAVEELLSSGHPIDVALFGRMVADLPMLNVDAACQVAHAISTHPVEIEFDYYTAVDDENPAEETGAGMIGHVEFNSATLYRYATVAYPQLVANLGDDHDAALKALDLFLDAFVRSMPSGKQSSFAHRTLPTLVAVCVRADQPINLVSAFEEPVRSNRGVLADSVVRLAEESKQTTGLWSQTPSLVAATYRPTTGSGQATVEDVFGPSIPFPDLRQRTLAHVRDTSRPRQP